MSNERTKAPYSQKSPVPENYGWSSTLTPTLLRFKCSLVSQGESGNFCGCDELFDHYRHTREALCNQKSMLSAA